VGSDGREDQRMDDARMSSASGPGNTGASTESKHAIPVSDGRQTHTRETHMNTEDNEMIQTPWGKKRWGTIRQAFEQRDELLAALKKSERHIAQLCDMVNDLAIKQGLGRKVHPEDWMGPAR